MLAEVEHQEVGGVVAGGNVVGGVLAFRGLDEGQRLDEPVELVADLPGPFLAALVFVGYGDETQHAVIELTYNYGVDHYDLGDAFGHIAIEVPDVAAACTAVREKGGAVTREAGPVKGGTTVIAFVQDPDGYKIELIQR